jgi:hypothetical protein
MIRHSPPSGLDDKSATRQARSGVNFSPEIASCEFRAAVALREVRTEPVRIDHNGQDRMIGHQMTPPADVRGGKRAVR